MDTDTVQICEEPNKEKSLLKYRPEIDGLRCIAVLAVIFYHAGFKALFKGGFVGVDVFFVISGYLMTSIILSEIEAGEFTLQGFYERRARRILPMLYLTLLIFYLPAYYCMIEKNFNFFKQSVSWSSIGASNFLFARTTRGYFDANTDFIPLVHTWTLGVEEQFYFLISLIFFAFWRFGKATVLNVLISLASVSFTLTFMKELNALYKFYMLYSRFWELAIGSIIVFLPKQDKSEIYSYVGLCAILFSIFCYNDKMQNPSYFTLLPTCGTALVILFSNETLIGKFLSRKPFVSIGLVSFSAYLLHQPLFALTRLQSITQLSHAVFFCLSIFTLVLAFLTWKFIENPFRNRNLIKFHYIIIASVILIISFHIFSFFLSNNNKMPTQKLEYKNFTNSSFPLSPSTKSIFNQTSTKSTPFDEREITFGIDSTRKCHQTANFCKIGRYKETRAPSYFLTGDSMALSLSPAFDELESTGLFASHTFLYLWLLGAHNDQQESIFRYISTNNSTIKKIFIAGTWSLNGLGTNFETMVSAFHLTVSQYASIKVHVYIIQAPPVQPDLLGDVRQFYFNFWRSNQLTNENLRKASISRQNYKLQLQRFEKEILEKYRNNSAVTFIDIEDVLCDNDYCTVGTQDHAYFNDPRHLTPFKAKSMKSRFEKYV